MKLRERIDVLRRHWTIVLVAALVGLLVAGVAHWLVKPQYTASMQFYVSSQLVDPNAQAAYQGAQFSQQRVSSYSELLTSERVGAALVQRLGLTDEPVEVASQIGATTTPDSVLLVVSATDASPERAAAMVNTIGEVFPQMVADIERPSKPNSRAPVVVRVVDPADVPVEPSSPGLPVTLVLGLLAGIVVGVGAALARDAADKTVRTSEQLSERVKAPSLGAIGHDAAITSRPLVVRDVPQSPVSEAFRQLRTNLQYVDVDKPPQAVVVTSAKAGEGKSTTLVNLALALSMAGERVAVVDADLRRPRLAELVGVEEAVGLTSVLAGRVSVDEATQRALDAFDVIASGPVPPNPSELLATRQMVELLNALRARYDVILIDTPPLLPVTDGAAMATAADGAILVCRAGSTTATDLDAAVDSLTAVSARLLGTVLTMAPGDGTQGYGKYGYHYYGSSTTTATEQPAKAGSLG